QGFNQWDLTKEILKSFPAGYKAKDD
ncbi:MAG: hypothetical protein ACI848_001757, partial [Roseivirga sp.]